MHRSRLRVPGTAVLLLTVSILAPPPTLAGQEVVESAAPRDPDLRLADEPLLRVGIVDGPLEYIFGNVTGAVRLEDGGIVVADEQSGNLRRYDANGRHLWTSGRSGEGPGEYKGLRLLRNCPGAPLTVFDWSLDRITELDLDGNVLATRSLLAAGVRPYNAPLCAPDGRLVYTPWPDDMGESYEEGLAEGDLYRWRTALEAFDGDSVVTLRSGIPGAERFFIEAGASGPRWWGRDMVFAAAGAGVWYGTADDYELEHLDWTGRVTRVARWAGPDLTVTGDRVDSYREGWLARYDDDEARRNFEREVWPDIRDQLPERFPAYEALIALPDGAFWVKAHVWRARGEELHLLDANGVWLRRLMIPGGVVLDAGRDWVLLSQRDQLGVPTVVLYELVDTGR
ncbi:hypothetical protein [Candidatus Palauibacter sp.]|uniref:hypothetical protein n=1 Tax=Candidatus Palauibacter sp. TaxID=3101350 RepID=UPI003B52CB50